MFKKIKSVALVLLVVLVATFSFGCEINIANNGNSGNNGNNTNQYDNQEVTHITAIEIDDPIDRSTMVEQYMEATATVYVKTSSTTSRGSGIAVYAGGYIATNYHVIANAVDNAECTIEVEILIDEEYQFHSADLLWYNETFDLAVVRSAYYNIPYVKMLDRWVYSDNPLRIAEDIWSLSTPYYESLTNTYSEGTVSNNCATDKRISVAGGRLYEDLIQHSVAISPGSSGSGVFDKNGNLIGLNALGVAEVGAASLFFAVPIYPLINVIPNIVELNEDEDDSTAYIFPKIGLSGYDKFLSSWHDEVSDEKYNFNDNGFYILEVGTGGPSFGKLFTSEIITGISPTTSNIGGTGYFEIKTRNDMLYALSTFQVGDTVKVYYKSGAVNKTTEITLGS